MTPTQLNNGMTGTPIRLFRADSETRTEGSSSFSAHIKKTAVEPEKENMNIKKCI